MILAAPLDRPVLSRSELMDAVRSESERASPEAAARQDAIAEAVYALGVVVIYCGGMSLVAYFLLM
jgi:hypothetical protein